MVEGEYTLADLVDLTGSKRRSVQLWAEAGVIKALPVTERAGTGTHRRFNRNEAIIACVIDAFARRHLPIGELLRISAELRVLVAAPDSRALVDAAIQGSSKVFLAVEAWGDDDTWQVHLISTSATGREMSAALVSELGTTLTNLEWANAFTMLIQLNQYVASLR